MLKKYRKVNLYYNSLENKNITSEILTIHKKTSISALIKARYRIRTKKVLPIYQSYFCTFLNSEILKTLISDFCRIETFLLIIKSYLLVKLKKYFASYRLREKFPYSEIFWFFFPVFGLNM